MKYIIGISGGVDSCYVLYKCKQQHLDAVAVTFDNGWDNPIAKENVRRMIDYTGYQHKVYSCDLTEFREIQRAFLLSGTPHAECPTDVAVGKTLLMAKKEFGANRIITGHNRNEGTITNPDWSVVDGLYVKSVVKRHGRIKLKTFPNMNLWDHVQIKKVWCLLDDYEYDTNQAKKVLIDKFGWQPYGNKHYESIFTKFNQGLRYYRHGIDMRLVDNNPEYDLTKPPMSLVEFHKLLDIVCRELDLNPGQIMSAPFSDWRSYASYRKWILRIRKVI